MQQHCKIKCLPWPLSSSVRQRLTNFYQMYGRCYSIKSKWSAGSHKCGTGLWLVGVAVAHTGTLSKASDFHHLNSGKKSQQIVSVSYCQVRNQSKAYLGIIYVVCLSLAKCIGCSDRLKLYLCHCHRLLQVSSGLGQNPGPFWKLRLNVYSNIKQILMTYDGHRLVMNRFEIVELALLILFSIDKIAALS